MNASDESPAQGGRRPWLLLIHQIPPKPDYFRVKVRRRLLRLGAIPLKHTVYALPQSEEALEDFQWLARDIQAEGGEAVICEALFIAGMSDRELEGIGAGAGRRRPRPGAKAGRPPIGRGRSWVTRAGVKVDRIASAWLIRRFIDPKARFKFVPARGYRLAPRELGFDMFDAEFGHEAGRCTFETLLARFSLTDPALRALGEVVHDIDCKDEKFGRKETAGIASLIAGLAESEADDAARLERGGSLMESLYAHFRQAGKKRGLRT